MGFTWLCCYACSGRAEWDDFLNKMLSRILESMESGNVKIHLVSFLVYGRGEVRDGLSIENNTIKYGIKYNHINDALEDLFKRNKYDGFVYTGHSSGYVFGRNAHPAFHLKDLCKWIKTASLKAIIFDSCYCGTLECMYELYRYTKYVITTPVYHDETVLSIGAFYDYKKPLLNYLKSIVRAFPIQGNQRYSLRFTLVSIENIPPLVSFIKNHWDKLSWDKSGKAYQEDNYLYHICDVVGNLTKIQQEEFSQLINKALIMSEAKQEGKLYGPPHLCLGLYRESPEPLASELAFFNE